MDFVTDFELHKNKSARIVPIALEHYFISNRSVHDTITKHDNIYDFCIRQKASKNFHYEGIKKETGNITIYDKLIRYYVSGTGEKIYKIKNPECDTRAPARSQIEAGKWLCTVCNYLPASTRVEDCDIDYNYYIEKTENIIRRVDKNYKRTKAEDKRQLTLW